MPDKQLQQELKILIQGFISGVQIDEQYLIQSQLQLNRILDQCLQKSQNINESAGVTQQKCDIINQRLNKIPKLQSRIEALSKSFYQAHKRIEQINKNMSNIQKIEQLQAQYQGKPIQQQKVSKNEYNKIGYDINIGSMKIGENKEVNDVKKQRQKQKQKQKQDQGVQS